MEPGNDLRQEQYVLVRETGRANCGRSELSQIPWRFRTLQISLWMFVSGGVCVDGSGIGCRCRSGLVAARHIRGLSSLIRRRSTTGSYWAQTWHLWQNYTQCMRNVFSCRHEQFISLYAAHPTSTNGELYISLYSVCYMRKTILWMLF